MRILIVKLSAIGDVVHSLPVLSALREMYPNASIHWLIEEAAAGLLENHPLIDKVLVSKRKSWLKRLKKGDGRPLRDCIRFIQTLRSEPYDLVLDLQNLAKSSLWVALAKSRRKLGYYGTAEYAYVPLTEKVGPENFNLHAVDRYLTFIHYLGGPAGTPKFPLPLLPEHSLRAKKLIDKFGLNGKKLVVIHPRALWSTKLWEIEHFRSLSSKLQRNLGVGVIFTGSYDDRSYIQQIVAGIRPKPVSLCGQSTLLELAAIFKEADIAVTTDTGPMHLAAAIGTPVVALFGPTDPARTGPYGKDHTVMSTKLSCRPCFKKQCPDVRCMREILPERVYLTVRDKMLSMDAPAFSHPKNNE